MSELKSFPLPDAGEGLTEAEIINWHVAPGDEVDVNQIIVEIETAKAAVELPCPWAGVVTELLAEPGQTVEVGTPILTIDVDPNGAAPSPGEQAPAGAAAEPTSTGSTAASTNGSSSAGSGGSGGDESVATLVGYGPSKPSEVKRRRRTDSPGALNDAVSPSSGGNASFSSTTEYVPLAKPPVRKLAKELGVDLRTVTGHGTGGVITREDVHRAAAAPVNGTTPATAPAAGDEPTAEAGPAAGPAAGSAVAPSDAREHRVPIRSVRKATAQAMVSSAFTAPHVTEFLTVDVTPMMELRDRLKNQPAYSGVRLTPLAFAAKAMCMAAKRTPEANASWDEENEEIVYKDYIHLGVAAATQRGLIVPKVRDADAMNLAELAAAIDDLTDAARAGTTPPADMVNGTITITNVGVFGVDTGTPIINPGESAILAFGAIRDTPWVVDGQVVPRRVCQLALSFDHRLVDGQQGSQFLADVGALLSDPAVAMTF
ncbi:pyruvate dehydrogenase E2 component (dihydrolipoamide acetyltransferase) [Haloechinothrix alba]|uniref:Dihydrolipoamide acetyltransferase component of pyruvate dehydrogenase complex n=1 Tax=Haloechinothrix alba TaxID=664784 RepID=A0A238UZI9_9PSEU|nr:dihydrolipoamide acetyltransferase family protein [Haloechinothrix alba]SNR27157.1 pyruvate dehydrogenase E2 component (dihydrolipoamide acetyltransferase) [Haloechinothrix alba]